MPAAAVPATLPIHLECVSWQLVQHHLLHGALRFEAVACDYLRSVPPADRSARFCLATRIDEPIEVLGLLQYRVGRDDLYFDYVRVRESCRQRGIGRHMVTEVVMHPTCLQLGRLHWMAGGNGCETLIRHLEHLRDHGRRLCGTSFRVLRGKTSAR
ncbi:MAG TPA: GNAT family N-acetyltransferase [Azonexus sp.]